MHGNKKKTALHAGRKLINLKHSVFVIFVAVVISQVMLKD